MLGTNRRICGLWFVFAGFVIAVACSSEPGINVAQSPVGGKSASSGKPSTETGSTPSTASNSTGTGSRASTNSVSKNEGGASNGDSTTVGDPSDGGSNGTDTADTTDTTDPTTTHLGGAGSTKKPRTSASSQGGAGSSGTKSGGGGTVNYAEGGSRFIGAVAGAGPTCTNKEKDEGEADIDCGGICNPNRCEVGLACATALDCFTTSCVSAKCAKPLVIIKNAGCVSGSATTKCPTTGQDMRVRVQLMNVTEAALDIKGMEIRYYFTNEVADSPGAEARVDDNSFSTIKGGAYTVSIVKMETPAAAADHYVSIKITGGTIAPDKNRVCDRSADSTDCAELEMNIHTVDYATGTFDPSNDYSFVPASGYVNNGNITVHKGTDVIWGTPPA